MGYGTSLGTSHEDEISYVLEQGMADNRSGKQRSDQSEINQNTKSGDFQSRFYGTDTSTMPLEASRSFTDALKSFGGTQTPEKPFETKLSPFEEQNFQVWKQKYAPKDSGEDYDFRGAFKAGATPDPETNHWVDTFKKPNHPTFSDQSQYYKDAPDKAGSWDGDRFIPPAQASSIADDWFGTGKNDIRPALGHFFKDLVTLPQRAIQNSQFSLDTGTYDPSTSMETVLNTVGTGAAFAEKGALGSAGGKLGPTTSDPWVDNYVDHFFKKTPAADQTDAALKQIQAELDAQTAKGENWLTAEAESKLGKLNVTKDKAPSMEQMPLLDTEAATWHPYTKDQLHPDNFYKVNQNDLSLKQAQDLHETYHDFKWDNITKEEYLDEMAEYEKFSAMNAKGSKSIPITESGKPVNQSPFGPWKDVKDALPMTHGQKVIHDMLDDYPELLNPFKDKKLTPKEKFLEALDKIDGQVKSTFANIRDKYINTVNDAKLEPKVTVPPEIAAKGYTEPAYRGLKVYSDNTTNPVYNYGTSSEEGRMYSTSSPVLADMYTDYLSKHPGYKVPEGAFKEGSQVMPLYINTKDYHYYDAKGSHWTSANPKAIEQALDKKKKGVIVDNVRDEPNSTSSLPPKKIFITFKSGASTVKSRFAKDFDPSSPNILHGIGSVATAGAAAGYLTDEGDRKN